MMMKRSNDFKCFQLEKMRDLEGDNLIICYSNRKNPGSIKGSVSNPLFVEPLKF
jgi:hypothetical protein